MIPAGLGLLALAIALAFAGKRMWTGDNPLPVVGTELADDGASASSLAKAFAKLSPGEWAVTPLPPGGDGRAFAVRFVPKDDRNPSLVGRAVVSPRGPFTVGRLALTVERSGHAAQVEDYARRLSDGLLEHGEPRSRAAMMDLLQDTESAVPPPGWVFPSRVVKGSAFTACTAPGEEALATFGIVLLAVGGNDSAAREKVDALEAELFASFAKRKDSPSAGRPAREGPEGPVAFGSDEKYDKHARSTAYEVASRWEGAEQVSAADVARAFPGPVRGEADRLLGRRTLEADGERWFTFEDVGARMRFRAVMLSGSPDAEKLARLPITGTSASLPGSLRWSGKVVGMELDDERRQVFVVTDFRFEWEPSRG